MSPSHRGSLLSRLLALPWAVVAWTTGEGLDATEKRERNRTLERRLQSAGITIAVAGVIWTVQTLAAVDKRSEVQAAQMMFLQADIARERWLEADVRQIREIAAATNQRVQTMDARIAELERHAAMSARAAK